MGFLRKHFGQANTLAGLGILYMVVRQTVPPQYALIVDGIAGVLGIGGVVVPDHSTPK